VYETTNGHAPGAEQLTAEEYPSSSEEEEEDDQHKKDKIFLRYSTPLQLIESRQLATEAHLFCHLLLFRIVVALITSRTVFAPDEHWQSLEIAHDIVFGYGFKTWEWRDRRLQLDNSGWGNGPIRSILYPALFVPAYWILQTLRLDDTILLVSTTFQTFNVNYSNPFICYNRLSSRA